MKYATLEGTKKFESKINSLGDGAFRDAQGLRLASLGIGTYGGNWDEDTDKKYIEALIEYIRKGGNVIDTASNYRFQRSERCVGKAFKELSGEFEREEVFVCTKGGFLAFDGEPPADIDKYFDEHFVDTGIAKREELVGGSHIITPKFIEAQVYQSLANLDLESIDLYYIHNPESQLKDGDRYLFEARIAKAFEKLEELRLGGKIRFYGVSSWDGFRVLPDVEKYHSLQRFVQIAEQVGGSNHGFRFIQFPFNLAMPEAYLIPNQPVQGKAMPVLKAAEELGITSIGATSLLQGQLNHSVPIHIRNTLGKLTTDAQTSLQFSRSAPGISTALVGMSSKSHVDENMLLMAEPVATASEFESLFE